MGWRERLRGVVPDEAFAPPASEESIAEAGDALGVRPPDALCSLWRETDGLHGGRGPRLWSVREVIEQNLELRAYPEQNDLYMTFESLLCFADKGGGDLYFFPIQADGRVNRPDVFVWEHETDSRVWCASNLERFLAERLAPPD